MIGILSTIAPPFNREQIKSQALWAATQAVLLIQEHKVLFATLQSMRSRHANLPTKHGSTLALCVDAMVMVDSGDSFLFFQHVFSCLIFQHATETETETQEAYEVLVNALEQGAELGECVRVIEAELAKRELPGDVRRANRQVWRIFSPHTYVMVQATPPVDVASSKGLLLHGG